MLVGMIFFILLEQIISMFIKKIAYRVSDSMNPWISFEADRVIHELGKVKKNELSNCD